MGKSMKYGETNHHKAIFYNQSSQTLINPLYQCKVVDLWDGEKHYDFTHFCVTPITV